MATRFCPPVATIDPAPTKMSAKVPTASTMARLYQSLSVVRSQTLLESSARLKVERDVLALPEAGLGNVVTETVPGVG
jgi:hypothetical protein